MKHLKSFTELNESMTSDDIISTEVLKFNFRDEDLICILHNSPKDRFYCVLEVLTMDGEPYIDLSTNIPNNDLTYAIWVKSGGMEEEISDILVTENKLTKSTATTESGYDSFIKYDFSEELANEING